MRGTRAAGLSLVGASTSQVFSSLSNVIISMALARGAGAPGLGEFTIAFTVYLIAVGFQRSLVAEPFHALPQGENFKVDETHMVGSSLLFALACAGIAAIVGSFLTLPYLLALAIVLPAVNLQDAVRYIAFRRDRPSVATLVDALWVAASIAAWPVVSAGSASLAVAVWGLGGAFGAVAGLWLLQVWPAAPRPSIVWWWTHARRLGSRLGLAGVAYTVTDQLAVLAVALFITDRALGELRAGQIVVQPMIILLAALQVFLLPRLAGKSVESLYGRTPVLVSGAAGVVAAAVLGVTLLALRPIGVLLFGGGVAVLLSIAFPLALRTLFGAVVAGLVIALKADHQGGAFVGARLVGGLVGLIAIVVGAALSGVVGAAWGMAFQGLLYALLLARAWARAGSQARVIASR